MKFQNAPKYAQMGQKQLPIHEKKSHLQIVEIKSTIMEIINAMSRMNFRPDTIRKRVGELEESTEEFTQNVAKGDKRLKK